MNKTAASAMLCFIVFLVIFATWQLYQGNLEAAFSTLPFLVIVYLLLNRRKREPDNE